MTINDKLSENQKNDFFTHVDRSCIYGAHIPTTTIVLVLSTWQRSLGGNGSVHDCEFKDSRADRIDCWMAENNLM